MSDFPRRFGPYVLLKPLARGGMGELYLAIGGARGMEKLCVIKKVLPHLVAPDNVQRFRDEAMVVVKLSHGNLVTVFDAGHNQDEIYLAMDFIDGRDLLATWNRCAERRVPFAMDVVVYIIKELARGLGYAHAFGGLNLVHRDVSPANVLLSYTGEVKLTDFGLATSTLKLQHTAPGIIFGKLSYLAPEQARSEPLDGRADIYAAGILLWEMLTGQQLFPVKSSSSPASPPGSPRRDTTAEALERLRNPQVAPPSTLTSRVPPELDRITMKALAPDRNLRYQTGEELRADLAAFLAKMAPETDADRLAKFLRPLFEEDVDRDAREREQLVQHANNLLSGTAHFSGPSLAQQGAAARAGAKHPEDAHGHDEVHGQDPRVNTTIGGRYILRRLCGEGAMGRVYDGHHIDIGRRVAVKILHATFRHSDDVVERFRREARAASRIEHPNIVDVTDWGTTPDGAFYFVMEYLDGVSLEELLGREAPLPFERATLITAQICRALQAAHAADIVHRDLKPANVMLINRREEDDFVKVLDFGISKDMEIDAAGPRRAGLTRPDVAVGTPIYMSPEQATGMPADVRTDVYAVGGLLYEMLTGCPPCAGDDIIAVLNKKATEDPKPVRTLRPDIPAPLERLITKALARSPTDRHASMTTLKDDVLACLAVLQGAPTPARPRREFRSGPTRLTPRLLTLQKRSRRAAVIAAVALGAVALTVGLALRGARTSDRTSPSAENSVPAAAQGVTPTIAAAAPEAAGTAAPSNGPVIVQLDDNRLFVQKGASLPEAQVAAVTRARFLKSARKLGGGSETTVAAKPDPQPAHPPSPPLSPPAPVAAARPAGQAVEILSRAQVAFNKGNYPEAIRRGREAIAAGAAASGRLVLGDTYYHMERYADALREYDAALAADPGNAPARRGRDLARAASARASATP